MRPNIELHIEELALHGFAPADRHHIAKAVERELARLFAEQGVPTSLDQGAEVARLDGGAFEVAQGCKAEAVGVQVAQAIYGGIAK